MDQVSSWNEIASGMKTYIMNEAGWLGQFGRLTWILLACCVAAVGPALINTWKLVSAMWQLPGPFAWPLIGNALLFNVSPRARLNTMVSVCNYKEGLTRFWLGFDPNVFIYKAHLVERILSSSKHIEKGWFYKMFHPWFKLGLLTSTGKKWQSRRKLLTPTFHYKILEGFIEVFNHNSMKLVDKLHMETAGEPIDIYPFIVRCTLDIICETAMGINLNVQDEAQSKYLKSVQTMSTLTQHRMWRPWLHLDFLYRMLGPYHEFDQALKVVHGFTSDAINRRNEERIKNKANLNESTYAEVKKRRLAFLDLLLEYSESDSQLSIEDIQEEVDTFMFAGHDTISASINWTLYMLGLHPEILEKVQQELDEVFGDNNRAITSDDLNQLKYLECCMKESTRIYPSVTLIARQVNEDLQLDRFLIRSGTTVHVMLYQLYRDPAYFPDPEVFQPERFAPENAKALPTYAFIPFSAGPRNCIGQKFAMMEMKILLCNILRQFHVTSQVPREDLKVTMDVILRPENGNILKLVPRNARSCNGYVHQFLQENQPKRTMERHCL